MAKRLLTHSVGILHVHSDYSHDGRDSLAGLRAFAVAKGIAFVGLTDHAEDLDAAAFERLRAGCAEQSDASVRLIPGLEFRFAGYDGLHLLALGLTGWIEPRTPEEFIRLARGRADLTVVAHPHLFRYRLPEPIAEGIDAIEVWNAAHNTRYLPDPRAIVLLNEVRRRRPEVVGTVGLDQHDSRNDREVRILLHRAGSNPLAEIRAGRFTNRGRTMRFPAAVGWGGMRLGLLRGIRTIYDQVERIQDRTARAFGSRRSASDVQRTTDAGSLLCVANFGADTGYAWDHIEGLYARLADQLVSKGICTYVAYPRMGDSPRNLATSAARPVVFPISLRSPKSLWAAFGFIRRHRVRVVYLTDRSARSFAFPLLRLAGARWIIVHDRSSGERTVPRGLRFALKWLLARIPGFVADRVICVSEYVAQRQRTVALLPSARVTRIWNGALLPNAPGEGRGEARERLGLPQLRPVVVCCSRAVEDKGVEHLIRAFELLGDRWPAGTARPILAYLGDGPDRPRLERLGDALRGRGDLLVGGYQADVTPYLRAADVCVVPSVWQEAFGWSVVEPMAHGRPVVASRVGGIPEILRDGVEGLLVPPGDPPAIADALFRLLTDPDAAAAMGEAGRRRAAEQFRRDQQVQAVTREVERGFTDRWGIPQMRLV